MPGKAGRVALPVPAAAECPAILGSAFHAGSSPCSSVLVSQAEHLAKQSSRSNPPLEDAIILEDKGPNLPVLHCGVSLLQPFSIS